MAFVDVAVQQQQTPGSVAYADLAAGEVRVYPSTDNTIRFVDHLGIERTLAVSGIAAALASLTLTGTGGAGYLGLPEQASAPTSEADTVRVYADASNRPAWIGENNKTAALDATANAANAVYTLPPASDTLLGQKLSVAMGGLAGVNNVSYDRLYLPAQLPTSGSTTTDKDIYTVPAGKRALLGIGSFNAGVMPITAFFSVKIGGVYYRVSSSVAVASLTAQAFTPSMFIFEPGDVVGLRLTITPLVLTQVAVSGGTVTVTGTITGGGSNAFSGKSFVIGGFTNSGNNGTFTCTGSSTTTLTFATTTQVNETHAGTAQERTGLNVFAEIILFDDTSYLKTSRITSFSVGNNTVYTCPSNFISVPFGYNNIANLGIVPGQVLHANASGGSVNVTFNVVQSGGSVAANNVIGKPAAIVDTGIGSTSFGYEFQAGDFLNDTSDSSGSQMAWYTHWQYPT